MFYLDNTVSGQTVYIPKNEFVPTENKTLEERTVVVNQDVTIVEPSGTYKGLSKVIVDATDYAQQNYNGGFEDGYTDGYSSGYTEGYDSGYTSGNTDGFESGYTSGETHQKSLLASTAFTENGHYTRENGWNEVDVALRIEELRQIGRLTQNGVFRFDPDEGYDYMQAVEVEVGIPLSSITITGNTAITVDEGAFTSITVDVPQTGSSAELGTKFITENGSYSASTDNLDGYSAITVNVPQTGGSFITFVDYVHTDPLSGLTNIYIDTGIFPTTATTMRFKYQGKGLDAGSKYVGFSKRNEEDVYTGATDNTDYRLFTASLVAYWDFNRSRGMNNYQSIKTDGVDYDLTIGNNYVYDHNREKTILSGNTQTNNPAPNIPIMVNVSAIWLKSLEIWEGETKVFDGKAAFDNNGRIGLYDSISGTLKAQMQQDVAMTYEFTGSTIPLSSITITGNTAITVSDKAYTGITVNVPQTGHTDQELEEAFESGYTSGHTEGMNDQKQLLTTTAFTENGSYQRENGWSGITVNVDTASTYNSGYTSGYTDGYNSGYTSGYTDGVDSVDTASTYQSGYTDGYDSGYTDGYASGSSQGYNSGLESALYGAYYPVDSATNKSYCTHFPDLENGKMIYFDIISTSRRQANKMLGGDYSNRDEHYLMIGYDNSNNEVDIQINAKGTPSGITTNAYMTLFNPTSGSIVYNPNQRICGEISVTDTECNYGVACLGFVPYKYTVQGDFTGSYPIKFNQDFASAFTLCKVVYKDIATGAFEHYFSYDSNTNEIKDWITGNIAPTYDYNGNRVYGVLESKEL